MPDDGQKIASYLDYLRRRAVGETWAGEHSYFHQLEKEVTDIIDSLCDIKAHPDTARLETAIVCLRAIECGEMNVTPAVHARACLAAIAARLGKVENAESID